MNHLNSIKLKDTTAFSIKIINWLIDNSKKLNLLIMPVSAPYEKIDRKKMFIDLKNQVIKELPKESADLSNVGSMVFFYENGMAHGLSITFGKNDLPDKDRETYDRRLSAFKQKMPSRMYGFGMPLLRMALSIYGIRDSLAYIALQADLKSYTLLGFSKENLFYTWGKDLLKVSLSQTYGNDNDIFLHVRQPLTILNKKEREDALLFSNYETGLTFYDGSIKKQTYKEMKKASYKKAFSPKAGKDDMDEWVKKSYKDVMETRQANEVYWNGLLETLLNEAGVEFSRNTFSSERSISIKREFRKNRLLTSSPIGIDSSDIVGISEDEIRMTYVIDDSEPGRVQKIKHALCESLKNLTEKSKINIALHEPVSSKGISDADIIIGAMPDEKDQWRVCQLESNTDAYGKQRRSKLTDGKVSESQFIEDSKLLDQFKKESFNKKTQETKKEYYESDVLSKAITEVILKKWISSDVFSRKIESNIEPIEKERSFIAFSSLSWKIKAKEKPVLDKKTKDKLRKSMSDEPKDSPFNFFSTCFEFSIGGDTMNFRNMDILSDFGLRKQSVHKSLSGYLQSKGRSQSTSIKLAGHLNNLDSYFVSQIDEGFKNSGSLYLFETEGIEIIGIWKLEPSQECLLTEMSFSPNDESIEQFIKKELRSGGFSRASNVSNIGENKKATHEAEYECDISGDRIKIARKILSEKMKMDRALLKEFRKVYTKGQSSKPVFTEHDAVPIYAGLMSDIIGVLNESGIKETIYEKITTLAIGS